MIYGAIVAGGTGTRMNADIPKQFLMLDDRPVLMHTVKKFLSADPVDIIYIGVHKDWVEETEKMCRDMKYDMKKIRIICGGSNRNDTIDKIIKAIDSENKITDDDIIITHDGVRPFISSSEIIESIDKARTNCGATLSMPCTDTLLYSENGNIIDNVPDRSRFYRAVTPQTFNLSLLKKIFDKISAEEKAAYTDVASILTGAGYSVSLILSNDNNIKITTPKDMKLARLICEEEKQND